MLAPVAMLGDLLHLRPVRVRYHRMSVSVLLERLCPSWERVSGLGLAHGYFPCLTQACVLASWLSSFRKVWICHGEIKRLKSVCGHLQWEHMCAYDMCVSMCM